MTKELEALERIKYYGFYDDYGNSHCLVDTYKKELDLIEIALKEHENDKQVWKNYLKEIKNLPPIEVQMRLKALKIIKERKVNAGEFIDMLEDWPTITYEDWLIYKEENGYYLQDELTEFELGIIIKEEFDLLKEVLL